MALWVSSKNETEEPAVLLEGECFMQSKEWKHITSLRNTNPRKYVDKRDYDEVDINALFSMAEENVLEGVFACFPINYDENDSFIDAIRSHFIDDSIRTKNEANLDLRQLLLFYSKTHRNALISTGMDFEAFHEKVNSISHSIEIMIATTQMLRKNIFVYQNGCVKKSRLPTINVYTASNAELRPSDTIFIYEDVSENGQQFFLPIRIISDELFKIYGYCDNKTIRCYKYEADDLFQRIKQEPIANQDGPIVVVEVSDDSSSNEERIHNEEITNLTIPNNTTASEIIRRIYNDFRKRKGSSPSEVFRLSEKDIDDMLQLIPSNIVACTQQQVFKRLCDTHSQASQFSTDKFTTNRQKLDFVPNAKFEVVECQGGGHCLFRALSFSLFGVEKHYMFLRLLCVIVFLQRYKEFQASVTAANSVAEEDNFNRTFKRVCIVRYNPFSTTSEYFPGICALMAITSLIEQHICVLFCGLDKTNLPKTEELWYAYDEIYSVSAQSPALLFYGNHYDLLVRKNLPNVTTTVSITMKGAIDRNSGKVNFMDTPVPSVPFTNDPKIDYNNDAISDRVLSIRLTNIGNIFEQINSQFDEVPMSVDSCAHVTELTNSHTERALKMMITSVFRKKTGFTFSKVKVSQRLPGVSVVIHEAFAKLSKKTPLEMDKYASKNATDDPFVNYGRLEDKFAKNSIKGPVTYTTTQFKHATFKLKSILHESDTPLETSGAKMEYHFGIYGSVYALQRPCLVANQIVFNAGPADLALLHIPSTSIHTLMKTLKTEDGSGSSGIPENSCKLFCEKSLLVHRHFLDTHSIQYDFVILRHHQYFTSGIGGLLQMASLGVTNFILKNAALSSFQLLKKEDLIHDCKLNPNFIEELETTMKHF